MAIVLDGWGVVVRRAAVETTLPKGLAGWFELVPSRMACADHALCFVAFMVMEDATTFALMAPEQHREPER